jgi:hypothetical protein
MGAQLLTEVVPRIPPSNNNTTAAQSVEQFANPHGAPVGLHDIVKCRFQTAHGRTLLAWTSNGPVPPFKVRLQRATLAFKLLEPFPGGDVVGTKLHAKVIRDSWSPFAEILPVFPILT